MYSWEDCWLSDFINILIEYQYLPSLYCEGSGVIRLVATNALYSTSGLVMVTPVAAIGSDI